MPIQPVYDFDNSAEAIAANIRRGRRLQGEAMKRSFAAAGRFLRDLIVSRPYRFASKSRLALRAGAERGRGNAWTC